MTTPRVALLTSSDLADQLLDMSGGAGSDGLLVRKVRRALQQGLQEISAHRVWSYFRRRVTLNFRAPYSTGTIAYVNSTRAVTITSGTWPTWANRAWLRIGNNSYRVSARNSGTSLILDANNNPGEDVAAGTSYQLYQDSALLPFDCASILECYTTTNRQKLVGISADAFEDRKLSDYDVGVPHCFTITGDDWVAGAMCIRFHPVPSGEQQIAFYYDRTQQPLRIWKYNTGTVSAACNMSSLTGTGTAFNATMVGAVIRFGTTLKEPTALEGSDPYLEERVIISVESPTTLTLDQPVDSAYTNVKYTISDLVDIEPTAMRTAVINASALHFARERNADSTELSRRSTAFVDALKLAMQTDKRLTLHDSGVGGDGIGFPTAHSPTNAGYYQS